MYKYIVVIIREGVPEVTGFYSLSDALEYEDKAGIKWSETFVCEVLKGPKV